MEVIYKVDNKTFTDKKEAEKYEKSIIEKRIKEAEEKRAKEEEEKRIKAEKEEMEKQIGDAWDKYYNLVVEYTDKFVDKEKVLNSFFGDWF